MQSRAPRRLIASLAILAVCMPVAGADLVLDEVLVEGTRLWELRQQMVQLEDKFYALYNELNTDRDFEVHCHIEAPTGRIIKERVCRLAFVENAQEREVQAMLEGHAAPPADAVHQARTPEFEAHFMKVVNSDPRLRKLVRQRESLEQKYDKERQQRSANRGWFRFEK